MGFEVEASAARGPSLAGRLRRLALGGGLVLFSYGAAADGKWLYLEFQPAQKQAQVRLVSDGVEDGAVQSIKRTSNSDCLAQTDDSLLKLSSSAGFFPQQRLIGVKRTSQGATCGQVRNNQSLSLALGEDERIARQKVLEASLSLVIHKNVRILIEARNGEVVVQRYEVLAGSYASETVDDGVPMTSMTCPIKPNGACIVPLQGEHFDSLEFSTTAASTGEAGAWSLGGGTSRFRLLYETGLACGDFEGSEQSTLRRLNDVGLSDPEECPDLIPARLDFDGETLTFLADYGVITPGAEPAFAFDVAWRTEFLQGPDPQAVPYDEDEPQATFAQQVPFSVQWFGPGSTPPPSQAYLIDQCPGLPIFSADELDEDGDPLLVGLEFPDGFDESENGDNDMSSELPGFQFGCLVKREIELVEEDPLCPTDAIGVCVRVKESGYLRGDWTATRTLR